MTAAQPRGPGPENMGNTAPFKPHHPHFPQAAKRKADHAKGSNAQGVRALQAPALSCSCITEPTLQDCHIRTALMTTCRPDNHRWGKQFNARPAWQAQL